MLENTVFDRELAPDGGLLGKMHDDAGFRQAVREWLEEVVDKRRQLDALGPSSYYDTQQWWMAERNKAGLGTPHWPREFGGVGMSLSNQVIVAEEMAFARAPTMGLFTVSLNHVPATLLAHGTDEQKAKYLPDVARGAVWCQGFSEPGAGSDLAALRTRAVRNGDHYIVNGQKIWSSFSMFAGNCILLARTDPGAQKHAGITYFIMDMNSAGVEVRPIKQSNGDSEFAELFLTNVRIPISERVGAEGEGWKVAQATLSAERGILSFERGEHLRYEIEEFYKGALDEDAAWLKDAGLKREFMRLVGEVQACRKLLRRLLREAGEMSVQQAATVPQVKVINTVLRQSVADFMQRVQGLNGKRFYAGEHMHLQPLYAYITSFGGTIAGGSNEIMRNILAERVLGMPKG